VENGMNFIFAGILIVMILILLVLSAFLIRLLMFRPLFIAKSTKPSESSLQQYANAMLEKLAEENRLKQDMELMEYANSKVKSKPLLPISTNENQGGMTSVRSQSKELVPFNMSATDKTLWEEFNS
jgi:hypothetical protein